jgi:hypothetical protein
LNVSCYFHGTSPFLAVDWVRYPFIVMAIAMTQLKNKNRGWQL